MPCSIPKDLDLYPEIGKKEMKFIDAKYQNRWDIKQGRITCKITKVMKL